MEIQAAEGLRIEAQCLELPPELRLVRPCEHHERPDVAPRVRQLLELRLVRPDVAARVRRWISLLCRSNTFVVPIRLR